MHFTISHLAENRGKAEAVRHGVLQAFAAGADYIGWWDADCATPLEAIPQFIAVLDAKPAIALVCGVRLRLWATPFSGGLAGSGAAGSSPGPQR
jgi:GT2 family glycosyltransferase